MILKRMDMRDSDIPIKINLRNSKVTYIFA